MKPIKQAAMKQQAKKTTDPEVPPKTEKPIRVMAHTRTGKPIAVVAHTRTVPKKK